MAAAVVVDPNPTAGTECGGRPRTGVPFEPLAGGIEFGGETREPAPAVRFRTFAGVGREMVVDQAEAADGRPVTVDRGVPVVRS